MSATSVYEPVFVPPQGRAFEESLSRTAFRRLTLLSTAIWLVATWAMLTRPWLARLDFCASPTVDCPELPHPLLQRPMAYAVIAVPLLLGLAAIWWHARRGSTGSRRIPGASSVGPRAVLYLAVGFLALFVGTGFAASGYQAAHRDGAVLCDENAKARGMVASQWDSHITAGTCWMVDADGGTHLYMHDEFTMPIDTTIASFPGHAMPLLFVFTGPFVMVVLRRIVRVTSAGPAPPPRPQDS